MVAREFQLPFGFFVKWECPKIHGADGLDLVVGLSMPWLHINTTTSRKSLVPAVAEHGPHRRLGQFNTVLQRMGRNEISAVIRPNSCQIVKEC
jgi:hypothetical protein